MKFTRYGIKLYCFFLLVSLIPLCIAGIIVYKYVYDKTKVELVREQHLDLRSLNKDLQNLLYQKTARVTGFSADGFVRDCVERVSLGFPESPQISK